MVDPAMIPRIDGDMEPLVAGHADAIATAGTGFAETGAAVHSSWQPFGSTLPKPESELASAVATETLAWEEAQQRCVAAIRAVSGAGPAADVRPGDVVPARFVSYAPVAATTPVPGRGPSRPL